MYNNIIQFISNLFLMLQIVKDLIKYKLSLIKYNLMIITICEKLRQNNILYVKFIQWNIQEYCNIDEELKQYFSKFSSNVPYTDKDIDYKLINSIETYFNNKLIFNNNYIPINSGTTALVFKGKLNEKPVAIKILRKNIFKEINIGIKNISNIMNKIIFILSFFYEITNNLNSLINDNTKLLLSQCDLLNEVKNIDKFKKSLGYFNKNIIIPHVYCEFTEFSKNIIVMDFLEGKTVNEYKEKDIYYYGDIITKLIINSYLIFKVVHADLHTGNIMILDKEKSVGIIDFGIIIELNSKQSNHIFNLFISLANSNINLMMKSLTNILITKGSNILKIEEILKDPIEIIKNDLFHKKKKLSINNLIKVIRIIVSKINGNVHIDPHASNILLSLISSLNTIDKITKEQYGVGDIISNHLSTDTFFD